MFPSHVNEKQIAESAFAFFTYVTNLSRLATDSPVVCCADELLLRCK